MKNTRLKNRLLNNKHSVFFATFSRYEKGKRLPTNGMVEPILSFFLPRVRNLVLLDEPHPVSDIIDPFVEIYEQGVLKKIFRISFYFYFPIYLFCMLPSKNYTRISYKLRDFFSVIFTVFMQRKKYNLFIGLEAINACAGILLKKIGKVETVIYYVSDYSPTRFGKTLINSLYLWLDRFCVEHADFTWDVSPAIQKARAQVGLDPEKKYNVIHVPNALFPSQIKSFPIEKRISDSLVYIGTLDEDFGVDLAIKAFGEVRKKRASAILHIIGGGKNFAKLKMLVRRMKLEDSVNFYGFIVNNDEVARIVRTSYIGLAPYRAFSDSFRWYGDAGKIRQYIASGLPVVTTHVPPLGRYVVEQGAGIMTADTVKDFSEGIVRLLSDRLLYAKLANVARRLSRYNTWENVYIKAFDDMLSLDKRHIDDSDRLTCL